MSKHPQEPKVQKLHLKYLQVTSNHLLLPFLVCCTPWIQYCYVTWIKNFLTFHSLSSIYNILIRYWSWLTSQHFLSLYPFFIYWKSFTYDKQHEIQESFMVLYTLHRHFFMKIGYRDGKGDDKAFYVSIKNDIYERISNIVTQTKYTERCYSIHPLPSTPDFQACLINIRISYAKKEFIFWWMSYLLNTPIHVKFEWIPKELDWNVGYCFF